AHAHVHATRRHIVRSIDRFGLERTMHIPEPAVRKFGVPPYLDGPGVLGVHAPVRAVDVVRAPSGDHARAELAAAQPAGAIISLLRMYTVDGVVDIWRLAQPHLVVEPLGRGLRRLVSACGITGKADLHALQVADTAVAHQLGRITELDGRTLLAADLEDASRGLHGIAQGATLRDGERGGLLQVHVFAGAHRVNADERVPVVRRADHDSVDIFVGQQLVIVGIAG